MERAEVLLLLSAVGAPGVADKLVLRELGRLLVSAEDALHRQGQALAELGARVDRLEAAARRPMLAEVTAAESS